MGVVAMLEGKNEIPARPVIGKCRARRREGRRPRRAGAAKGALLDFMSKWIAAASTGRGPQKIERPPARRTKRAIRTDDAATDETSLRKNQIDKGRARWLDDLPPDQAGKCGNFRVPSRSVCSIRLTSHSRYRFIADSTPPDRS